MQPVFSCFWTEYRKIWTRNNSIFGHFSRSVGNKTKKISNWWLKEHKAGRIFKKTNF